MIGMDLFALPSGYGAFLTDLKTRIRRAQVKVSLAANRGTNRMVEFDRHPCYTLA